MRIDPGYCTFCGAKMWIEWHAGGFLHATGERLFWQVYICPNTTPFLNGFFTRHDRVDYRYSAHPAQWFGLSESVLLFLVGETDE